MGKSRYLVTFVFDEKLDIMLFPKVFKLRSASSPDEVTVPENTIFFIFVNADVDTPEELQTAFLGLKIGLKASISCSIPYKIENDGMHYFVGIPKTIKGVDGVLNTSTRIFTPLAFAGINYQIIDL